MKRVIIESPYAGNIEFNLCYLRACMHDSITVHHEAPFASHGLYTQPGVLKDEDPVERQLGIASGFVWRDLADGTVVYSDLGITKGMQYGIDHAAKTGKPVVCRSLGGVWAMTNCWGKHLSQVSDYAWPEEAYNTIGAFDTKHWSK